jgi:hypothetical protein
MRHRILATVLIALGLGRAAAAQGGATPEATSPATPEGGAAGAPTGAAPTSAAPAGTDGAPAGAANDGAGLFEQSLGAGAAAAAATAESGPPPALPFTLNGYVRGDLFVGKVSGARQAIVNGDYGELATVLRTAKSPYGDGFAEMRFRYGLQGQTQGTFVDVREAYVNAYLGRLDLRLGKQIIVWGRADALNPTNNLTPTDFRIRSPLEDDLRVGNVGARAVLRLAPAPLRLEGVWMPVYLPTELPTVGLPPFVSFGAPVFPAPTLGNGLAAGRLHLELPAIEMSVSYLYGYAPLPGLTLSSLTFDLQNPSAVVARTAYDQQVVGFDFSTALGDLMTLRGEAAYRHPFDYQQKIYAARPDLQYALGVDHTFGSLSVIAQYVGRYVFDWVKQNGPTRDLDPNVLLMDPTMVAPTVRQMAIDDISLQLAKTNQILFSQTARIQSLATLRVEWLLAHDTLSLSTLALLNVTTREWVITPRVGYKLTDAMIAYVGAQVFHGPKDTLFGIIENQLSAGYAELRFTY